MKLFKSLSKNTKIIVAATLLCYIVTILMVANSIKFNTKPKVTVKATVSQIEEVESSSGADDTPSWSYRIYINYHYLGKTYENIYFTEETSGTEYTEGQKVEAEIYKDEPDTVASDTAVNFVFFLGFSVILTVVSFTSIKKEKNKKED